MALSALREVTGLFYMAKRGPKKKRTHANGAVVNIGNPPVVG